MYMMPNQTQVCIFIYLFEQMNTLSYLLNVLHPGPPYQQSQEVTDKHGGSCLMGCTLGHSSLRFIKLRKCFPIHITRFTHCAN